MQQQQQHMVKPSENFKAAASRADARNDFSLDYENAYCAKQNDFRRCLLFRTRNLRHPAAFGLLLAVA